MVSTGWVPNTPRTGFPPAAATMAAAAAASTMRGPPANTTPRYEAPAVTAAAASCARTSPQILTSTTTAHHLGERAYLHRWIGRGRQCGPHQHAIGPGRRRSLHVGKRAHAALGDGDAVGRNA